MQVQGLGKMKIDVIEAKLINSYGLFKIDPKCKVTLGAQVF